MAGFVNALLSGQVTNSLPTRAQMVINRVPAAVATIVSSGFTTAGDGGAATYVRAGGPFTDGSSFQSQDGAWWKLSQSTVDLAMFGAIGGITTPYSTLPDDTVAIQNAVTYAMANGVELTVPGRSFRFTKSLNWGKASPFDGLPLRVRGINHGHSKLVADLSEAWPAIDLTNQNAARIEHLCFETTTTSQHTCGWLVAETTGSGANNMRFDNCNFIDESANSKYLMFGLCADQCMIDNSAMTSLYSVGVFFSNKNPNAIASKFWAIAATDADHTAFSSKNTSFLGCIGPALWVQSYLGVTLTNTYCGTIGGVGHTMGALRLGSGTQIVNTAARNTMCATVLGLRVEDDTATPTATLAVVTGSIAPTGDNMTSTLTVTATSSGAIAVGMLLAGNGVANTTVVLANVSANVWLVGGIQTTASTTIKSCKYSTPSVFIEDYIYESYFQGVLTTQGAGSFGGPGYHVNTTASVQVSWSPFNYCGPLVGGRFHCTNGPFGSSGYAGSFNQALSRGYWIGGAITGLDNYTANSALALFGSSAAGISDIQSENPTYAVPTWLSSQTGVVCPDGTPNTPINFRHKLVCENGVLGVGAYTGGSGLQQIMSPAFNPAWLINTNGSIDDLVDPTGDITLTGTFNAAWAAGGQLSFTASQTVGGVLNTASLISMTGIPAYVAGSAFRLTIKMIGGASQWLAITTLQIDGTAPMSATSTVLLSSQGLNQGAGANFNINGSISNSGSNPLVAGVYYTVG